jgi:hypothetical protein
VNMTIDCNKCVYVYVYVHVCTCMCVCVCVCIYIYIYIYMSEQINIKQKFPENPELVHVTFVVNKVVPRQVSLRILQFSPVNIIPPWFHTHISG